MRSGRSVASRLLIAGALLAPAAIAAPAFTVPTEQFDDPALLVKRTLGNLIFSDPDLSEPPGQSCASCHSAAAAMADPDPSSPTPEGAVAGRFGSRNAPGLTYAAFTPPLYFNAIKDTWIGGLFVDGRAATLEEQAAGPLLNPLEMNNPDRASVVAKVARAPYAWLFREVFGEKVFDDTAKAFRHITEALAAFQRGPYFSPFTSKFDAFMAGKAELTPAEARGWALFNDMDKGNCANCHLTTPLNDGKTILFTDFSYDNIGTPRNPDNPFYDQPARFNPQGRNFVDLGLGGRIVAPELKGQFKTPTLRNVARTAPYMHNGYFSDLKAVVQFYNDRDLRPRCANARFTREADAQAQGCWPEPEVKENVNTSRLGDLGLSDEEIDAIVAFLHTLTDGWRPDAEPTPSRRR